MFNTDFDIRNIWTLVLLICLALLMIYLAVSKALRKKAKIRLISNYTQTETITIVEYDMYGQPYINGYHAVLYSQV